MRTSTIFLTAIALAGCGGGNEPEADPHSPATLGAPEHGFQLRTGGAAVAPGTEVEYCEVVLVPGAPGEDIWVQRMESAMAKGSHHLIISRVIAGSELDARLTAGDRAECPFGARQFGDEYEDVFGSQAPYRTDDLPAGVGRKFSGGQKLIVDYHYFNATREPLTADIAINFYTAEPGTIEHQVQTDGFYNLTIRIPAREQAAFTGECRFDQDVRVHKLIRHTHRWGTRFSTWFAGGTRDGELAYESTHFEDTDHAYAEPLLVRAGEGFRFECDYLNTETHELAFGNTVNDEMCILFVTYWSAQGGGEIPAQSCFLRTIGDDGVARPQLGEP